MKKAITGTLIFLSLLALLLRFGLNPIASFLGYQTKAGIKVTSIPPAQVEIGGEVVGITPYLNESLEEGEMDLKLTSESGSWQGKIKLNRGTITVLNRELALSDASSSGETLTLYPGSGVIITSSPDKALLLVDGQETGFTPINLKLKSGEHQFILSKEGFLKRIIKAKIPDNLSLHLQVDLSLAALDTTIQTPKIIKEIPVMVTQTPVGFLRVRDKPSTQGKEIAKFATGERLIMVEDLGSWVKIKLLDEEVGYVSSEYIQKLKL